MYINTLLIVLQPLPVVDVTKEEDKYGNDGDKFNRFGRGVVGGVESLSSRLTSALSVNIIFDKSLLCPVESTLLQITYLYACVHVICVERYLGVNGCIPVDGVQNNLKLRALDKKLISCTLLHCVY